MKGAQRAMLWVAISHSVNMGDVCVAHSTHHPFPQVQAGHAGRAVREGRGGRSAPAQPVRHHHRGHWPESAHIQLYNGRNRRRIQRRAGPCLQLCRPQDRRFLRDRLGLGAWLTIHWEAKAHCPACSTHKKNVTSRHTHATTMQDRIKKRLTWRLSSCAMMGSSLAGRAHHKLQGRVGTQLLLLLQIKTQPHLGCCLAAATAAASAIFNDSDVLWHNEHNVLWS
jgi:hypothetical protein